MKLWTKQVFAISRADIGVVQGRGLCPFFEHPQLGNSKTMNSTYGTDVIRAVPGIGGLGARHSRDLNCQMADVTKSSVTFEYEGQGEHVLSAGCPVLQPTRIVHREIRHSDVPELIEITSPATFTMQEEDAR
ncbi:cupin [Tateyamaria sp. ANG-S1]|uniref:cupin n=1 Tax=Tateyamaria sp. ANG-S1 TaxID=1577905 RepID=UPI00126A2ABD|nr:cupin [Tateyamaria sp. ANG-S1]